MADAAGVSARKTLSLYSPSDGFVLMRNAYPKQRVTPKTELYTVADLSTVWVIADIYEYEAPEIKLFQTATITLAYLPGRAFRGKVAYMYPQLDNTSVCGFSRIFNVRRETFLNRMSVADQDAREGS